MSKTAKLLMLLSAIVVLAAIASPAHAIQSCPGAMSMAKSAPCVQAMDEVCSPVGWNEDVLMTDNGDGTMTAAFVYNPKCLDDPVPCRIASRLVVVMIKCEAHDAVCM
jgi:hypothetical protein